MRYIIDSRSLNSPEDVTFVALSTPTGNGHRYIEDLYNKGVRHFVISKNFKGRIQNEKDIDVLYVDDTLEYLKSEAVKKLETFENIKIGVTGSRGKTTVKEFINLLLNNKSNRSPRSFNSQIGVPLSILNIDLKQQYPAIIEVGISKSGEMKKQLDLLKPEIVVLTNVTDEHSNGFKSREEQIKEKLLLAKEAEYLIFLSGDAELEEIIRNFLLNINPTIKLIKVKGEKDKIELEISCSGNILENISLNFSPVIFNDEKNELYEKHILADATLALATVWILDKSNLVKCNIPDVVLRPLRTRLDMREGYNDSILLIDSFTSDALSIAQTFDKSRRLALDKSKLIFIIYNKVNNELKIPSEKIQTIIKEARSWGYEKIFIVDDNKNLRTELDDKKINVCPSIRNLLEILPASSLQSAVLLFHTPLLTDDFKDLLSHYETNLHESFLEINIDSLIHNYKFFKSRLKENTQVICMLKAFGYGTGSHEIAKDLELQGTDAIAVAVVDEGVELRKKGIKCPIIILNPRAHNFDALREFNLEPVIYNFHLLREIAHFVTLNNLYNFPIHVKIETGMRRLGFTIAELPQLNEKLKKLESGILVKTVFSHLATADCLELDDYTLTQFKLFKECARTIEDSLGYSVKKHILNTAGIIRFPEAQMDMVRLGIGLYGIPTLPAPLETGLKQVASLYSTIISIKSWKKGDSVGYSCKGVLEQDAVIATIPIGYADGIDRRLGNGEGFMYVNGHKCPTVGNICMDLCMIDVTGVKDCKIGDLVEIFGKHISIESISESLQTIPYEILTSVSKRVNRIYYRE